ncbi:MAG: hypothetical protein KC910_24250 [Candidatus Eremiobacteraeota bacterium]|nr:hypothetical protein [Candidatus Eremiobacteraeota bacterium]
MLKNITLKLDEQILARVRHRAVDENKSVSGWVADLIVRALGEVDDFEAARAGALRALEEGMPLGGEPLSREDLHERR